MATVRNISAEGIGLLVNRPIRSGMFLTLELPAPPPRISKQFRIRVTHARSHPGGHWWVLGGAFAHKLTKEELDNLKSRTPVILPSADRRTTLRHSTHLQNPCPLLRATEEGPWWASVRDITLRGIGLITDRPFKPGMFLTIQLPTADGQLGKSRLLRVTNARPQRGNRWWIIGGVLLSKMTREELAELV